MEPTVGTGVAVALALGLVEVAKTAVNALKRRRNGGTQPGLGLTEHEHQWLGQLHEWHSIRDQDGRPLWYTPPGSGQVLEEIRDQGRTQAENSREMVRLLKEIRQRLPLNNKPG